jgi:phosphoglycolate phosphatase-like HAD superfamily hydrolase
MKFICDFDGTIINSLARTYFLFSRLTQPEIISYQRYITEKRAGKSNQYILKKHFNISSEDYIEFENKWFELIESEEFIKYNIIFRFSLKALSILKSYGDLYLVSNRQNRLILYQELYKFGILHFFSIILATEQKETKKELINRKIVVKNKEHIFMIGDTGEDIITAKDLGIISVAVSSGNRNKTILRSYDPDYIFDNILFFARFIDLNNGKIP